MPLSPEIIEARIACHIAALRVLAARTLVRHTETASCPPPSAPAPSRRPRPRRDIVPPLARRLGGGGHKL
jgi:hypothetical protein